ncbi:MAG: tRNA (guanosine(46)-N7)-methyltransferase TrmB [Verrucomicrobiota bacterium]
MAKTKIDPELEVDPRYSLSSADILQMYNWQEIFQNNYPIEIELGAGDGGFILERARANPHVNFIAIERLRGRIRKIIKGASRHQLANLRAIQLESTYVIERLCPYQSLKTIHIMFPDPWPKKKHHKRRLMQTEFLLKALQTLAFHGELRFTTDHQEYFQWTEEIFQILESSTAWRRIELWDWQRDPLTDFQKAFISEGRSFYRARWIKA